MLVNALYNIVDQIFIGQGVGMLGNAATNIAFPVTTISTAAALLLGIGGASNYNLEMGAGNEHKASEIAGSALSTLVITGVSIAAVILIFLRPLLIFFGATSDAVQNSAAKKTKSNKNLKNSTKNGKPWRNALGFPFLFFDVFLN